MFTRIGLEGVWSLQLDPQKQGLTLPFTDTLMLPNTISNAGKGAVNGEALTGSLTDAYKFEGYAWCFREVEVPEELAGKACWLHLERTRVTTVWVNGRELGSRNSLNAPHRYELTGIVQPGKNLLTIRVDNTDYPTKGGHLTSPDTQTNWNGITGRLELQFFGAAYLEDVQVYPEAANRMFNITANVAGSGAVAVAVSAESLNSDVDHRVVEQVFAVTEKRISLQYAMGREALLWSGAKPQLYRLAIRLLDSVGQTVDTLEIVTGLREFKADGDKFTINGTRTFLRGKHDGLIFPLTGFAPTTVEEWLRVLEIAKSYGINHYRFHTCCPPEAAFAAADRLGIYMEPELPFWGTVTDETYEQHNQAEQDYLIGEGYAILREFGNHPSFVMMSLGNELWGSKPRIDRMLKDYKAYDGRHLYTQGSNNFQFAPEILEHDDFFCGVRFSRDRLFRGSYAMCDAPLGHIQTERPGTMKDYDGQIMPTAYGAVDHGVGGSGTVQIQYGTGVKTVEVGGTDGALVPRIPVISHEIGQYATYPDFREIEKYQGPLKARNFEIFRERLEDKGLGHLAREYFEASGKLAVACYKEELEAALRSRRLAGFHLLDLQDFSGQGTALVGILDAFMDSKGLVTPEEWRTFCSDTVLLARFMKYNWESGERFDAQLELVSFESGLAVSGVELDWRLLSGSGSTVLVQGTVNAVLSEQENYANLGGLSLLIPDVAEMTKVILSLQLRNTDIRKSYDLWIYPRELAPEPEEIHCHEELTGEVLQLLERGEKVLLMPRPQQLTNSIEGFYCSDFWCYPMFRSISESMNKEVPVGTMGLLIDNNHPVFRDFPCEKHSTYPWWSIVSHSRSLIMDNTAPAWSPVVQTIDNFERNHKLGLLLECRVGEGRLLICPLDREKVADTPEGRQFLYSLVRYMNSEEFQPAYEASVRELQELLF